MLLFSLEIQSGTCLRPQIPALRPRCQAKTFPFKNIWNPLCIVGYTLLLQGPDPQRKLLHPKVIIAVVHWKLSLRRYTTEILFHLYHIPVLPASKCPRHHFYVLLDCLLRILMSNCFPKFPKIKPLNSTKAQRAAVLQELVHTNKACILHQTRSSAQLLFPFPTTTANAGYRHM